MTENDMKAAMDKEATDAVIYCDGGCFPNPGRKVIAFIIMTKLTQLSDALVRGEGTSNEAEYEAIIEALERAKGLGLKKIKVKSDSMLAVNQLNHKWEVYEERLMELKKRVMELAKNFEKVDFEWVNSSANPTHELVEEFIQGNLYGTKRK